MSSEEDDYMSDAFLAKLDDKRPGLITGKKAEKLMREEKIRNLVFLGRWKIFVFYCKRITSGNTSCSITRKTIKDSKMNVIEKNKG